MSAMTGRSTEFEALAAAALPRAIELTEAICRIPAPTGQEAERARFVAAQLQRRGLDVHIDELDNVLARRKGDGRGMPALMISAHLDTVFPASTELKVVRDDREMTGPGIGDNSLAVACLIVLAELLEQAGLHTGGDLLLVANVGEEGLGNLRGMRAAVDRFEDEIGAVLVLEGHRLGRVTHGAVGSRRIRLSVTGLGGHSWGAFGTPSAIHALCTIVHQIAALRPPKEPKTTFNVGLIEGGVSVNTIAPSASAVIDMRSTDPAALAELTGRIESIIQGQRNDGIIPAIEVVGERPAGALPLETEIVQGTMNVVRSLGLQPEPGFASTDANIPISRGIPAVCIGLTRGRRAHTPGETIELAPITLGLRQLLHLVDLFPVRPR